MKFVRKTLARVRKADLTYNLINDGDRIAVGVSGGKDSSMLLYCLIFYKMYAKVDFTIIPIILDLGFDTFNPAPLIEFFENLGTTIIVEDAKTIFPILQANTPNGKHLPCSICSRMKKAAINQAAHKYNCNKVAFGHHYDDAIETLVLNSVYGGRLATFSPKMHLARENIVFIRPLVLAREEEITKATRELEIPIIESGCPANRHTEREGVKRDLENLYKKYNQSYKNIENILINGEKSDLWFDRKEYKVDNSHYLCLVNNVEQSISLNNAYYKENGKIIKYQEGVQYFLIIGRKHVEGVFISKIVDNGELEIIYLSEKFKRKLGKIKMALKEHHHIIN